MNETKKTETKGGISFFGLLAAIFITLKLLHKIDWSWWMVLAPLWVPAAIALTITIVIALTALIVFLIKRTKHTRRVNAAKPTFVSEIIDRNRRS